MDAPFIPVHLSWPPNTLGSFRVALDASRHFAAVVRNEHDSWDHSRRVSFSVRYSLIHDVSCRDWPDALGVIHTATRAEPNRNESDRLSSAQFYRPSVYTSSGILTAYSILIAPRCSRRVTSLRCCRAEWAWFEGLLSPRLVPCEILINTWRVMQGLARRLRHLSQCSPNRTKPNQIGPPE